MNIPRPIRDKVVCAVNMQQKDDYQIELVPGVEISMRSDFGFDNKLSKPVLAEILSTPLNVDYVHAGDFVLCHHNSFNRENQGYIYGDLGIRDRHRRHLFSLETEMLWLKMTEAGDAMPLPGFITVERLEKKVDTTLYIPETARKTDENLFRVIFTGGILPKQEGMGYSFLRPGDLILCEKHSDVDVNFTWNKKIKKTIRMKYDDVMAILPKNSPVYEQALTD